MTQNTIEFKNCYGLYKFFDSLQDNLFTESDLILENNKMSIRGMDMSRICMIDITFNELVCCCSIISEEEKKLGLNLEDLSKLLKTRKNDKKKVKFTFENDKLIVDKFNHKSKAIKTLGKLDLESDNSAIDNLTKIDYSNIIKVDKRIMDDFFYESGLYSEIIRVKFDKKGLHFLEEGQIGNSDMVFEIEQLRHYDCKDIEQFNHESVESSYSLSFLKLVKGFLPIMDVQDNISIELKKDHPLKITIEIDSIACKMEFFLAPRIEEKDYDDDDEF